MASHGRFLKVLSLLLIVALFLAACERPLQTGDEESAEATAIAESEAETPTEEAEAQVETTAETEVEPAPTEEPTEEATDIAEATDTPEVAAEAKATATEESVETTGAAEAEATATVEADAEQVETQTAAEETPAATSESGTEVVAEGEAETVTEESAAAETTEAEAEAEGEESVAVQADTTSSETLPATHTVAPGENLYRIGLKYGMSWVTLAWYNNLPNPNYVYAGQVLKIPGGTTPPTQPPTEPDSPNYTNYVVKPGDTLFKISRAFGVSPDAIAEANGIVNPNLIYAGQVLKIPTAAPETPPQTTHTVKPGETLYKISLQYGVHWLAIAQANHLSSPYIIYPGQTLVIPSG